MTCDLYRFYDADNRLLYVGISLHAAHRASEHRGDKTWWGDVARMDVEHLVDRAEALEAERRAIVEERPRWNVVHNMRTATPQQIAWICQHCDDLIGDGAGYVGVDWGEAIRAEQAESEWDRQRDPWQPVPISELMSLPDDADWYVTHQACDPHPNRDDYWFDVARCRTIAELLDWNAHLLEKRWIGHTNWGRFIARRVA